MLLCKYNILLWHDLTQCYVYILYIDEHKYFEIIITPTQLVNHEEYMPHTSGNSLEGQTEV